MRERRKSLNGKSYRLALQALTPALENLFPTFSTDCFPAVVSRWEREFTCFCDSIFQGEGRMGVVYWMPGLGFGFLRRPRQPVPDVVYLTHPWVRTDYIPVVEARHDKVFSEVTHF